MGRSQTPYSIPLTVALIGTLKGTPFPTKPKHQGDPKGRGFWIFGSRVSAWGLGEEMVL